MSVFEFNAAMQGWIDAHVPEKPGAMTDAERDIAWEAVQIKMGMIN